MVVYKLGMGNPNVLLPFERPGETISSNMLILRFFVEGREIIFKTQVT